MFASCPCCSSFCIAERTPALKVQLNPLLTKWTGTQGSSRLAHPPPSASWTYTEASAPSSYLRAPGLPGYLLLHANYKPCIMINVILIMFLLHLSILSRSASPCLSSRSSPLIAAPRSPCSEASEPFSEGAEIQVANLDYRMSRKDLQQTLNDTFSRYGRVKRSQTMPIFHAMHICVLLTSK